jgi:copper transport protein
MRRFLAGLLLALTAVLVLVPAPPAAAHATLIATDPAEGAVLETAPEQVTFSFNESVIGVPAGITVFDATGTEIASSATVRDAQLIVSLDGEVDEGTLVVVWRLVSADGHPIGGSLSFSVGAPSDVVDVPTSSDTDTDAPVLLGVVRWLAYVGLLVAAGVAGFSALFLPLDPAAEEARRRLRGTVRLAAAVAVLAWWAAVPLVALYQLGLAASALGDGSTWSALALGEYVVPAAVTVGLALTLGARRGLVLGGCAVALAAPSLTGHTRATSPEALVIAVDVLHLAAGALWLGGLVALALVLRDLSGRGETAAVVLSRFSTWAAGILAVLVVAGSVMAWRVAGSLDALLDTTYGTLLIVKVLVVVVAVAIAAWNRFALLPRLRGADRTAERTTAAASVVRTTYAEAAVLLAVLLVTGFLVDRSPEPTVAVASSSTGTGSDSVQLDDITGEVTLEPLGVGPATLTLTMTDEAGEPAEGHEAPRMSLSTDDVDLGAVSLTNLGPGIYSGDVVLPTAGTWEVQVSLRTTEFDNPVQTVTFEVP